RRQRHLRSLHDLNRWRYRGDVRQSSGCGDAKQNRTAENFRRVEIVLRCRLPDRKRQPRRSVVRRIFKTIGGIRYAGGGPAQRLSPLPCLTGYRRRERDLWSRACAERRQFATTTDQAQLRDARWERHGDGEISLLRAGDEQRLEAIIGTQSRWRESQT